MQKTLPRRRKEGLKLLHRVIISGGGTGGHIFPAIAIANEIKGRYPDCEILFVGALGKMEMEKVPQAGYKIIGLPIAGIQRKFSLSNLLIPFKLLKSILMARKIIRTFKPERVVGVGGYASAALVYAASAFKIPILIQEQNSYAGLTNKWLAAKASRICVAYPGMERFFPAHKIVITGNPVRSELFRALHANPHEARKQLGFNPDKPLLLVIGGSLGARTINRSIQNSVRDFHAAGIQVLWQTGKQFQADHYGLEGIRSEMFINDMSTAYSAAELVVSRAGAISVSELALLGKPCVLVPSPNVAEDHQTKNALALSSQGAAVLIRDAEADARIKDTVLELMADSKKRETLASRIGSFAKPEALKHIADVLESLAI